MISQEAYFEAMFGSARKRTEVFLRRKIENATKENSDKYFQLHFMREEDVDRLFDDIHRRWGETLCNFFSPSQAAAITHIVTTCAELRSESPRLPAMNIKADAPEVVGR